MLRLNIADRWTASDFANLFESVNDLYALFVLLDAEQTRANEALLKNKLFPLAGVVGLVPLPIVGILLGQHLGRLVTDEEYRTLVVDQYATARLVPTLDIPLEVKRCQYASPGFTDLAGLGQVLGHLKELVLECVRHYVNRDERRIKNEILEQQRDSEALRNLEKKIELLERVGYSPEQRRRLLAEAAPAVMRLEHLAERGLLTDATDIENDG